MKEYTTQQLYDLREKNGSMESYGGADGYAQLLWDDSRPNGDKEVRVTGEDVIDLLNHIRAKQIDEIRSAQQALQAHGIRQTIPLSDAIDLLVGRLSKGKR